MFRPGVLSIEALNPGVCSGVRMLAGVLGVMGKGVPFMAIPGVLTVGVRFSFGVL